MTRLELLTLVTARARSNGFEFRRWYTARLGLPWISAEASLRLLDQQRRYYALLFSHEFASNFWKAGTEITFELPSNSFERRMPDGSLRVIKRKPFIRRSVRRDVWRYHLQKMALAEEPLRYLRRYLHIEEQLDPEPPPKDLPEEPEAGEPKGKAKADRKKTTASAKSPAKSSARKRATPRPLPSEPPAFLKRPYPGSSI